MMPINQLVPVTRLNSEPRRDTLEQCQACGAPLRRHSAPAAGEPEYWAYACGAELYRTDERTYVDGDPCGGVPREDPDAFDANDRSLYAVADGDDDLMHMIEETLCPLNDPRCVHDKAQCPTCGLPAPWASKLGCGLA
jgi:hypothetical protein